MFEFISPFISPQVALKMTPKAWGLLFMCVVEAVQWAQAEFSHEPEDVRKKEAYDFALKSWQLYQELLRDPATAEFIKANALPAAIDGVIKTFNTSLWFATSKPVSVGGYHNPAPVQAVSQIPGPAPISPVGGLP